MRDFGRFENEFLRRIMTFICRPPSVDIWYIHWTFINKKQKTKKKRRKTSEKKFDVNTRYPRRARWDYVLDEYIWNLTWINIWRVEETTKYCEVLRDLLFLLLFIYWRFMGSCAALRWFCTRIWIFTVLFHTYYSQFVLMYFCIYIYIYIYIYSTSLLYAAFISFSEVLSCVCYSACFHTISLYALFSEPCLPFHYSSPTEDPVVYCLPIVWRGPRSPRHTTEVLTTSLLQFFLLIIHFVFCFIFIRIFYLDKYSAHQNC